MTATQDESKVDELASLRLALRQSKCMDEPRCVEQLLSATSLSQQDRDYILHKARELVVCCRAQSHKAGTLDAFLQEFGLSNKEGVALMCLAEALLRVPDDETADRLIAEKINSGDWGAHKGQSASRFVNASVWGLMMTGRVVTLDAEITEGTETWMKRLVSRVGEPIIRAAVMQAMRIMGGQYVLGRTIPEAMRAGESANSPSTRFSFDMLGEGARTRADAKRYFDAYLQAIQSIGEAEKRTQPSVIDANGISVKLSALHPRYEFAHKEQVFAELLPDVHKLAVCAKNYGLGFSIDAEEADRLDLSLDIFESLARDNELAGWDGLGFVLQAYQKRAPRVAAWLIELGRDTDRCLMVRLVKGAYWDGEIKHAQEQGLEDYPVFTRKSHTDLCYQVCAEKLLAAQDAIFPQFATHNAYTVALVQQLAQNNGKRFEFQRLHGMGHLLYENLEGPAPSLRVYAPVGNHKDLLPYLVRRLLENGANSSFVNRFLDADVPIDQLVEDTVASVVAARPWRHTKIPLPIDLYRHAIGEKSGHGDGDACVNRANAKGIDLTAPLAVDVLLLNMRNAVETQWESGPISGGELKKQSPRPVCNPANNNHIVGSASEANAEDIEAALERSVTAQATWDAFGGEQRALILEQAAELMETHCAELMGITTAEAGRTIADGLSEVREAVDFCRYYGALARRHFARPLVLPGPTGESNELSLHGRGVFLCISPWNFPLAIFVGQITAALAAGNSVVAKPAEQTPLIAARAVQLLLQAGVPADVLQLLPGDGQRVGGALVNDVRIAGVAFTGSTKTAKSIHQQLARRSGPIVPLIAETGGQNVMLVDSTALPEQVVDDVIVSAFQSAGQRCSALRVLYLQQEIADNVLTMLRGAVQMLKLGDPSQLSTDVGPVIDKQAKAQLLAHVRRMDEEATLLAVHDFDEDNAAGSFVAPRVYEINSLRQLPEEVFGPILHVIRYRADQLDAVIDEINQSGYGLTLGVHSRIEGFAQHIFSTTRVGNTYINRNMVGAVVGVNPFGGRGLSGTGPKAGGPHYLYRFATEKTRSENIVAKGGNTQLFTLEE
ncbi:MAG: bifunctional proline dehydrogenase/L-glutamate gamma-semialdehyde dehydrogenase PutA [Pseudomonadales bacterium]